MKFGSPPSDDAAARTILCLGEGRQEFVSTNVESLRGKKSRFHTIKLNCWRKKEIRSP